MIAINETHKTASVFFFLFSFFVAAAAPLAAERFGDVDAGHAHNGAAGLLLPPAAVHWPTPSPSAAWGWGAVAFPPIVTYFLDQYGLRGSLLLMGGVCLNSIAASLPPPANVFLQETEASSFRAPLREASEATG